MQRVQKIDFINKIEYLVKIDKYLESLMLNDYEKWLAKFN